MPNEINTCLKNTSDDAFPSAIGKNMIFLRKIVIFHTKYPKNVLASLRNWKKYYFLLEKTSNQNVTSDKNDALIGQFGTYGYEKRS
jgi:hypothetical protein